MTGMKRGECANLSCLESVHVEVTHPSIECEIIDWATSLDQAGEVRCPETKAISGNYQL